MREWTQQLQPQVTTHTYQSFDHSRQYNAPHGSITIGSEPDRPSDR